MRTARASKQTLQQVYHCPARQSANRARFSTSSRQFVNPRRAPEFRQASKPSWTQYWSEQWRLAKKDYPIILPLGLFGVVASMSILTLLLWDDYARVKPQYSAYPTNVEYHLRQALQSIHVKPNPAKAEMHFIKALQTADEEGMDPYSPEVMGIRTRLAEMLEKFGHAKAAIEVLEGTIKMCEEKVKDIDRGVTEAQPEESKSLRKGMLKTIIRSRVRTASLYESDYMQDIMTAKQVLSDAVGLLVKESQDPQTKGFSEDNAAGLPLDEIASMLSQMGDLYATTGETPNAVQVYMLTLQPLRAACNGTRSCKEVQILSNIASTMDLAMKRPGAIINGKPATKESLAAARRSTLRWADQAIATAEVVKPQDRDDICEVGLISAEMTKADLLLEDGKNIQAREAFRSIIPRLKEKGLDALVKTAEQGIHRAGG
ncbi:hypothetical protein LTR70_002673 [Exophiala xenobiotica]|uniref:Uncharacterized protein n=1 Tax=Lithohypha guttulata TaxID=1690604 RepID=A0ABR0KJR6_9EURO|nr:hypothetical protein LTR24_001779 [Lithohypha guttulata]KAK5324600.1 hypothetical protein LTR70_002673 [Exophiala xenobiotica]